MGIGKSAYPVPFYYRPLLRWKYEVSRDMTIPISLNPPEDIQTTYGDLLRGDGAGILTLRRGFAWNGASGPAIDTDTFMRSSAVHDFLYGLINLRKLPEEYRGPADQVILDVSVNSGMWKIRAKNAWGWLRAFGWTAIKRTARDEQTEELMAP